MTRNPKNITKVILLIEMNPIFCVRSKAINEKERELQARAMEIVAAKVAIIIFSHEP